MNFILALLKSRDDFDCAISIICKFIKSVIVISNSVKWAADQWVNVLFDKLNLMNWNIFKVIIPDRNKKFFFEFWIEIFHRLNVRFFYFTAYHSQIDDQSERINQIVEIVFRYYISKMFNSVDWFKALKFIQQLLNNVISVIIDKISNEVDFDFISLQVADLKKSFIEINVFVVVTTTERILESQQIRIEMTNVIIFAQMNVKHHYDRKHQSLFMKKNEYALIRLHHEYQISINDILNKKYDQQYVDFFKILKKIDRLTYRLDLSAHWRINLVFFVTQLKIASIESNLYQRSRFIHFDSMFVENDTKRVKFYEIDFLINKREIARRESEYLIRWKEYESAYNEWRNISKFEDVMNLIKDYELIMQDTIFLSNRLILFFISQQKFSSIASFIRRLKLFFVSSSRKR